MPARARSETRLCEKERPIAAQALYRAGAGQAPAGYPFSLTSRPMFRKAQRGRKKIVPEERRTPPPRLKRNARLVVAAQSPFPSEPPKPPSIPPKVTFRDLTNWEMILQIAFQSAINNPFHMSPSLWTFRTMISVNGGRVSLLIVMVFVSSWRAR